MRKTANGAVALKSTLSPCVDLFAFVGSARNHPAQALSAFQRAYAHDPKLALRIALWLRDARGGAGERDTFRNILHWLERRHTAVAAQLAASGTVQSLGRWDDLLVLQNGAWPAVVDQVRQGLLAGDRLLGKWLPRRGPLAAKLASALGVSAKSWRQQVVSLSDTVEQRICAGDFASIRYAQVPSVAAARYQRLFRSRDEARYDAFIEEVMAGKATMHASAVFPHDIVKASSFNDEAATAQWSQIPRPAVAGDALVLCDVSPSMNCPVSGQTTAKEVCIALGLLLSESLPEPFKNQVLTFASTPEWHLVKGDSLRERADSLRSADWAGSTNIQAAFDAILARAQAYGGDFKIPSALVVFSDMEFDRAGLCNPLNHALAREKFAAAGFEAPTLVYWNLNGRLGNLPAGNEPGVVLVSGFSIKIAELVLSGQFDQLTPENIMRAAVCVPRYDVPGLTV